MASATPTQRATRSYRNRVSLADRQTDRQRLFENIQIQIPHHHDSDSISESASNRENGDFTIQDEGHFPRPDAVHGPHRILRILLRSDPLGQRLPERDKCPWPPFWQFSAASLERKCGKSSSTHGGCGRKGNGRESRNGASAFVG
jgi:hypothetical protein